MTDDLRLSVSKSKTFSQCKKQYQFSYILKMPKKEHSYHVFGSFCHRVLEVFHNYYLEGCLLPYNTAMGDAFKIALSEYKDKMTPEMKKECWVIIDKYLRIITKDKQNDLPFNVIACEKRFEIPIDNNIILNGAIDIVRMGADDVLEVCDYKTSKSKKYLAKDFFQLQTYAFVMLKEYPELKKIRGSYILLRHDFELLTRDFEIDEILSMERKFVDYAERIRSEKEFAPNPTVLCGWCDHLDICDAGKEKVNERDRSKVYGEVNW
jgi:RecB family exonuclease